MATLLRVLGVGFGLAVTLGNTVGAGILRGPGEVAAQLPHVWLFLAVWVAGGLYALLGALSMSELGAMVPRSGGYYVFARRAFGDFAGFVVGWSDWLAACGIIAATSILVGDYSAELIPALGGRQVVVALGTSVGLALLQARGVQWGSLIQGAASLLKVLLLLLVGILLVWGGPSSTPIQPQQPLPTPAGLALAVPLLVALQAVIYTYDGWYGIIYFGEEVRRPGRDVPRSMIGGVLLVMALYLLINLALVRVMPMPVMAGQTLAVGTAASLAFGDLGGALVRVAAIACLVSGINAYQLMASRIPLALGRDRLLPAAATRVNAGGTPTVGLLLSTLASSAFVATGSFRRVLALMAFFCVANYAMAFLAVFVLRRRAPHAPRPFRAPGHPWSTGLALLTSLAFLTGAVAGDTRNSLHSLLMLAAGYPAYRLIRHFGLRVRRSAGAA